MRELFACLVVTAALCAGSPCAAQITYSTGAVSSYPANPCFGPDLPFSVGSGARLRRLGPDDRFQFLAAGPANARDRSERRQQLPAPASADAGDVVQFGPEV